MISPGKHTQPNDSDSRRVAQRFVVVIPPLLHGIRAALQRQAAPGGPSTFPQLRCLGTLAKGPCTLGAMAEVHGVSAPTMSRLVDGLVARGLVHRAQDPVDRRQVVLTLSPAGEALRAELMERGVDNLAEVLGELAPDELAALELALAGLDRVAAERSARGRGAA
jgi:DNA-binding MarR family transcriptional regulator